MIRIEALGRTAVETIQKVVKGKRYYVDGYLRQDESRQVIPTKVRAFAVYKDDGPDQALYGEAILRAIDIIKSSRDKETALKELEGLVAAP